MSQPSSARSQISHQGSHSDRSRPRVMITLTGGGFLWEAKSLIRQLRDQVDLLYVTSTGDGWPKLEELGLPQGPIFVLPTVITFTERSLIRGAINATRGTLQATRILRKHRPDLVIGFGASIALPLFFAARLARVPSVFVETVTRVHELSRTAKILNRLRLPYRTYVQWPELADSNPGLVYRGTVL